MRKNLLVVQAEKEDVYKDIVRIPEDQRREGHGFAIREATLCVVRTGELHTYVFVRGLTARSDAVMGMDDRTRNLLGVSTGQRYDFEIEPAGLVGRFVWAWNAAEPAYRVSSQVALVSLLLGIIGLFLGVVSLMK